MYKKILIPTDGSPISTAAARAGVAFAQQIAAEILGIFVAPEYQYPIYVEMIPANYLTDEEHKEAMRKAGANYLGEIQKVADDAGREIFRYYCILGYACAGDCESSGREWLRFDFHGIAWKKRLGTVVVGKRNHKSLVDVSNSRARVLLQAESSQRLILGLRCNEPAAKIKWRRDWKSSTDRLSRISLQIG